MFAFVTGVNTCLEFGDKVCEEAFEVQGTSTNPNSQGPLKGRINRRHQVGQYNNEPRYDISNNVVCATSKGSEQTVRTRSLIRDFACCLNIL